MKTKGSGKRNAILLGGKILGSEELKKFEDIIDRKVVKVLEGKKQERDQQIAKARKWYVK